MQPTVLLLTIVYLISLSGTRFARAQCYSFASGSNANLTISIPKLPAPFVIREQDRITYSYQAPEVASVTIGGTIITGVPGTVGISLVSGATGTFLAMQVSGSFAATPNPPGGSLSIAVNLEAGPDSAFPLGLLPDGFPAVLPDLAKWTVVQDDKISGAISFPQNIVRVPGIYGSPITSIGSCSPPPQCTIEATTLAHVPGTVDTERVIHGGRIGVGENVRLSLTNNDTATWTLASGKGLLTEVTSTGCSETPPTGPLNGAQACFIAPYSDDLATVMANEGPSVSCSVPFTTVQPTGLVFQRLLSPPLSAPGYTFITLGRLSPNYFYSLGMYSVVLVTPGDVSFANIGIVEKDRRDAYISPLSNVLVPFGPRNAWLFSCDYDFNKGSPYGLGGRVSPYPTIWEYTYGSPAYSKATKVPFSKSLTTLEHTRDQEYTYKKVQVQDLATSGVWEDTPNAFASILTIPFDAHDAELGPLGRTKQEAYNACLADVRQQLGSVP